MSFNQLNKPNEQSSAMTQSTLSLSKSLGAKVFSNEDLQMSSSDTSAKNITDEGDEFVDASENQSDHSAVTTSMKSAGQKQTQHYASNEYCDKMYVVSGASIKYDRLPSNSDYTRYVLNIFVVRYELHQFRFNANRSFV